MSGRALCCLWRRWCSGRRVVWLVGPGCLTRPWAAARPRAVRAASFARRVDSLSGQAPPPPTGTAARPGPAAAHGHRSPALRPSGASTPAVRLVLLCVAPSCLLLSNFARNSPVTISVFELASLELERFWAVFKSDRGKLRADLVLPRLCCRPRAPQPGRCGYCASSTFACNSPVTISVFVLASLELQRFWALLKVHAIELHAEFLVCVTVVTHGHRSLVAWSGFVDRVF